MPNAEPDDSSKGRATDLHLGDRCPTLWLSVVEDSVYTRDLRNEKFQKRLYPGRIFLVRNCEGFQGTNVCVSYGATDSRHRPRLVERQCDVLLASMSGA